MYFPSYIKKIFMNMLKKLHNQLKIRVDINFNKIIIKNNKFIILNYLWLNTSVNFFYDLELYIEFYFMGWGHFFPT